MFNNSTPLTMPVAPIGYTNGNGGGLGGFGSDWIGLIVILAILGWGNGGFGGFGGGFGGNRCVEPCATQADVRAAVDQQTLISKLDQQTYGLADSTYALNNAITNGFFGVQNTLCQGFNGVDRAISDCCCQTQRAIDGVNYNMATQACDIKHAINDSTRSILDFLTTDKIATLQAENQALKFKASQAEQNAFITANQTAQTAELIRRLGADCPVPAYVVPNPNCCYNPFGFNYGNNGCGCA
jgi:hypothetical protein